MESHLEARLWNDVFSLAQDALGLPRGTIRATVLIETILAAFEMDEILYELREHCAGLNAGRWDYLFSIIKKFRSRGREFVLPDRNAVTMTAPFMRAYTELLVKTCHGRGAHAMGGMAAFIPSRRDPEVNAIALAKVRDDKTRESADGFDGSWVAHPDLVPLCKEVFDAVLGERPNQLDRLREEVSVTAPDLLAVANTPGPITEDGLRNNVSVALQYLASWLGGNGAVAIFNLMEDAATAEISRSQIWQWVHNEITLDDGPLVTRDLVVRSSPRSWGRSRAALGGAFDAARYEQAAALFTRWRWPTTTPSSSRCPRTSRCPEDRDGLPAARIPPGRALQAGRRGGTLEGTTPAPRGDDDQQLVPPDDRDLRAGRRDHRPRGAAHLRVRRPHLAPGHPGARRPAQDRGAGRRGGRANAPRRRCPSSPEARARACPAARCRTPRAC